MIYFFITLIIFSSVEVISKPLMKTGIDPFALTFWRFFIGFMILLGYIAIKNRVKEIFKIDKKELGYLILLGFINTFFSMSMLQMAVKYGNPATAAVIFCSNPVFVYFISVLQKTENLSAKRISGLFISIAGIIIIMLNNGLNMDTGSVFAILSSFSFALYTFFNKKVTEKVKPLIINTISFFFGIIINLLFLLISNRKIFVFEHVFLNGTNLTTFLYLGIGVSFLSYLTFVITIKKYSPVSASIIFLLKPALATIFSLLYLESALKSNFYIGLLLSISGSILIMRNNLLKKFIQRLK